MLTSQCQITSYAFGEASSSLSIEKRIQTARIEFMATSGINLSLMLEGFKCCYVQVTTSLKSISSCSSISLKTRSCHIAPQSDCP